MITSFAEYREHIRRLLSSLSTQGQFRFCVWCIERFPHEFGDVVWDGLTGPEQARFKEIVAEISATAANGLVTPAGRSRSLQLELEAFGPQDEVEAIEVHPDATEFRSLVWQSLEYIITEDIDNSCAVSMAFVNSWDYQNEGVDESYSLSNMFTYPQLRRELEIQEEWLAAAT